MKWLFVPLTLLAFSCTAQKKSTAALKNESGLLWQISGNGLNTPSYVYGTIHMICKEDFIFSNTLEEKVKEAQHIYLELDMDDPSLMLKMAGMTIMKDKSLQQLLKEEDYNLVSAFVKDSLGMPMMMINRMKPITLMSLLYMKVLPCPKQESYEMTFVERAKATKKNIEGLETLEEQMSVFDKIPDSIQAHMIVEMIRNMNDQRREFAEMVEAYKREDLQLLAAKMSASPEWKGYEDIMLVNRNKNWISKIETAMKSGTQLFAVGAGHLPGKEGVLNLLKEKGYSVQPIH